MVVALTGSVTAHDIEGDLSGMLKLLRNAEVYAPRSMGRCDILIAGGKVVACAPDLSCYCGLPGVETEDLSGMLVVPGFVDIHVHITGGGGEQGYASRVPELSLGDIAGNGVTTVLGLLGTDGVTRSQENLLAKARALTEQGITVRTLTGNYQYPPRVLTRGVTEDIVLIDLVVGVKTALADHRSSSMTVEELARLGSEARLGGMLSGKPGIVVVHMGSAPSGMDMIFKVIKNYDVPASVFIPTHCDRNALLAVQAAEFIKMGGTADFTASEDDEGCAAAVAALLMSDTGAITISSDAGGSLPLFDSSGKCIGMGVGKPSSLLAEFRRLINNHGIDMETALLPFTRNPARVLGMEGAKGYIDEGADADILLLDENLRVSRVYAKGKLISTGRAS